MTDRLSVVLAAIDAANAADPAREDGQPAELLYGRRMSEVLAEFAPAASVHLRIAARGQHVERWTRPRSAAPEGRAGYLRWREELKRFHAGRVAGFMAEAGWPEADRERVASLIRKEGIKRDPETQTLEDVICLVFIRWYFADFAAKHPREKVRDIVARTGRKMSPEGRRAALALGQPDDIAAALTRDVTDG
jgi:hypothetical protein